MKDNLADVGYPRKHCNSATDRPQYFGVITRIKSALVINFISMSYLDPTKEEIAGRQVYDSLL